MPSSLNGLALSPDNVQVTAHLELSRLFSIGLTDFRRLGAQYDVSINFISFNKLCIVYAIIVIGYLVHVL